MVALSRTLLIGFALLFSSSLLAVEIQASLDTQNVNRGDTVELTVTINEQVFNSEPDFSVLQQDFDVLSKRQSSQYSMINGRITSSTSWIITLLPKRMGYLAVPPITYEGARSKPIKLHVEKQKKVDPKTTNQLFFLDATIDKNEAYVQEQLIYTIRVLWSVELFDSSFSAPQIEDAVMEQLGDRRKYRTTLNGRSYEVMEFRYAVFPQKSGELTIPPAEVLATVFGNRRGFGRDPFNGKQVRRVSPELTVTVKPKPDEYPADKAWLPTRSLKLYENWSPDATKIKIGEPITRNIIIEAEGLVETLLPPVPTPSINGIKIYPEQANTNSTVGANGLLSKRVESQAIIATQAGTIELPSVEITWWDVNEEKVKTTSVAARTFEVIGSSAGLQTNQNTTPIPAPVTGPDDSAPQSLQTAPTNTTWQWIAIGSLALWVITLVGLIWVLFSKNTKHKPTQEGTQSPFNNAALKAAKKALQTACNQNDPKQAREAVIQLFRQHWKDNTIKNLNHIAGRANNEPLSSAFNNLDQCLYKSQGSGQADSSWDSRFLLNAVEETLAKGVTTQTKKELAPLYPT